MTWRTTAAVITILIALISTSCADGKKRYLPVFSNQPRISTLGFSVRPPHGGNWFEKIDPNSIIYYKQTSSDTYAIITRAIELRFPVQFSNYDDFFSYARKSKRLTKDSAQIKNVLVSFDRDQQSDNCLRYRQSYEDYRPNTLPGTPPSPFTEVDNIGVICVHPDNNRVGIDLYYQERHTPGNTTHSFAEEGESFLGSLSFLTLQAKR